MGFAPTIRGAYAFHWYSNARILEKRLVQLTLHFACGLRENNQDDTRRTRGENPIDVPEVRLLSSQVTVDPVFQGSRSSTQCRTSVKVQTSFEEHGEMSAYCDSGWPGRAND
jgi:hypothetical protein